METGTFRRSSLSKELRKLHQWIRDHELNKPVLSIFVAIHIALACMAAGFWNSTAVIAFLYALNLLMMIQAIDCEVRRKGTATKKRGMNNKSLKAQAVEYGFEEPESANLYVERWKHENLNVPPMFPLDRLAFLNAMHHHCSRKHFFFLKNSQLKKLAKKEVDKRQWYDECHPKRLLTDLFAVYIHRRALFFRNRHATSVGKSQFTKTFLGDKGVIETEIYCDRTVLYGPRDTWYGGEKSEDNVEEISIADLAKPDRNEEEKVEDGYFRKLSKRVSTALSNIKKKRSPSSEDENRS